MGKTANTRFEHTVVSNLQEDSVRNVRRPRILVVDDDPVVRRVVFELLNNRYTIVTASTGVQLPELMKRHRPDLIILDVILPWIDGFELCRIVKTAASGREIPVLFLTGCKDKEDILTGKEVGASGYLTKPFHAKDLCGEIERLLAECPI